MKKISLVLALVLILSTALTSCDFLGSVIPSLKRESEPTSTSELFDRMNAAMDGLDSYESSFTFNMDFTANGTKTTVNRSGDTVYLNTAEERFFYSATSSDTRIGGHFETVERVAAYDDGVAYLSSACGDTVSRLCSDNSADEFFECFVNSQSALSFEGVLSSAFIQEFTKNEDSTRTLKYSKFSKSALRDIAEMIGLNEESAGIKLTDVKISYITDSKYRCTKISCDFYSDLKDKPIAKFKCEYGKFAAATKTEFNKDTYKKVDDVRAVQWVYNYVSEFISGDVGSASFTSVHKSNSGGAGYETVYKESGNLSFEHVNGKPHYTMNSLANGQKWLYEYISGTLTVTADRDTTYYAINDADAKTFFFDTITNLSIVDYEVTDVRKLSDSEYRFECTLSDLERFGIIAEAGYFVRSLYYVVEISDGEVLSVKCHLAIRHASGSGYEIDTELIFGSVQTDEDSGGARV